MLSEDVGDPGNGDPAKLAAVSLAVGRSASKAREAPVNPCSGMSPFDPTNLLTGKSS